MVMRYLGGINNPSYNPLAANVTTGVTTVQDGGIYTTTSAAQATPTGQWVNDPYFNYSTTLLQADGISNGSQNNTFLDSSGNSFPVNRNGNPTQGTFTPFSAASGYWSNYFDGSGDYISIPDSATLELGTSDFCFECFFWTASLAGGSGTLLQKRSGTAVPPIVVWRNTASIQVYLSSSTQGDMVNAVSLGTVVTEKWYHVAVYRIGTAIYGSLNGVITVLNASTALSVLDNAIPYTIGANGNGSSEPWTGYITNARLVIGDSVYTSTSAPIPTMPFTYDEEANTQFLVLQDNRPLDNSTNEFTVTSFGNTAANTFNPFTKSTQYVPDVGGGSMYFDGTGDYLTLNGEAELAFGSNNFTIECWFYLNALPAVNGMIYDSRPAADGAYPCLFVAVTTNVLHYYVNTASRITGTTAIKLGQWNYVVVSRVSGETRMFLNGVQEGSTYTDSTTYLNGASRPIIANNGLNLNGILTGYISNLRVLNGTGTTSVTVPTAPFTPTASADTELLLSGTNAGIFDATAKIDLETVGNAQVSTAIKKYGSGSMSFDGTGDWLLVPHNQNLNFGTGDFTIEAWVNISNTTASRSLIGKGTASTGWGIYFNAAPTLFIFNHAASISYSSNYNLIQGAWYHLAVTRSGTGTNNLKMFINGFLILEATVTTDLSTTNNMYVGANRVGAVPMLGYIDDLRITKGLARYTSTFIPPPAPFPRQGPG